REGFAGFEFLALTPFGLPVLGLGIVYRLSARGGLASDGGTTEASKGGPGCAEWPSEYKLADREHRVVVTPRCPLVGKTLESLRMEYQSGAKLIAIQRGKALVEPTAQTEFLAGDILLVDLFAPDAEVEQLKQKFAL